MQLHIVTGRKYWKAWLSRGWILFLLTLTTACIPAGMRLPQSQALALLERKSGRIAYVGIDGNIYTMDQGGGRQVAITSDAKAPDATGAGQIYQHPSWSPDSLHLAFLGASGSDGSINAVTLYTSSPEGGELVEAFRGEERYPFYIYWSPDSQIVGFLTTNPLGGDVGLHLVAGTGGEVTELGRGDNIFWSWSPDNRSLLVHGRGTEGTSAPTSLTLLDVEGQVHEENLDFVPASFHAPAWSPNGDEMLLAAETADGQDGLLLIDREGNVKTVLTTVDSAISFDWSPDGKRLAYLTANPNDFENMDMLTVLDPDKPENKHTTPPTENVVAFFWSPNGKKVAYFVPEVIADVEGFGDGPVILMDLYVLDARSGKSSHVSAFVPSDNFVNVLPFFDQYQRSNTIWSPDSRNIVLSAKDEQGQPGIYVVEASGRLEPRFLIGGQLAFWSWR